VGSVAEDVIDETDSALSRAFHSRRKLRAKQHAPATTDCILASWPDVAAPLSEQLHVYMKKPQKEKIFEIKFRQVHA
jgi:hypothetical protein